MPLLVGALVALSVFLLVPPSASPRLRLVAEGLAPDPLDSLRSSLRRRFRGRSMQAERDASAIAALVALAAELRAGLPPALALVNASSSMWPTALAAIRLDGDIPDALRVDAQHVPVLRALAACWEAGATSGIGLADAVDQLANSERESADVRGQLEVQLAGPRATARMLALLPVIGILMGLMLGADPLGFLLGGPIGLACLGAGIALTVVGMWWTNRIAARVEARL